MSCTAVRKSLLGDAGDLAAARRVHAGHLDACRPCRALVEEVAAAERRLDAGLSRPSGLTEREAVALARSGVGADRPGSPAAIRLRRAAALGGVAAAAAALWFLWLAPGARQVDERSGPTVAGGDRPPPGATAARQDGRPALTGAAAGGAGGVAATENDGHEAGAIETAAGEFGVRVPEDRRVAVFRTSNPRIRVVWFYEEGGSDE